MKKWSIAIPWHCTVFIEVEAETEKEAIEKGECRVYPTLCHQCTDHVELGESNSDIESDAVEITS